MMHVGLTGSVASGKTSLAQRFAALGIAVFDADRTVHQLYEKPKVVEALAEKFSHVVTDGAINRVKLSEHLLDKPSDFPILERVIHAFVEQERLKFEARNEKAAWTIFDVPLLFETGLNAQMEVTITVCADKPLRLERALKRNGLSGSLFNMIESRQWPAERKAALADHVVLNNGNVAELTAEADRLFEILSLKAIGPQ